MRNRLVAAALFVTVIVSANPGDLPTIASFTGIVKMRVGEVWEDAKEGVEVRPDAVLDLAEKAHLEITLPGGKAVSFDGPLILSGNRLAGAADKVKWLSRALDRLPTGPIPNSLQAPRSDTTKAAPIASPRGTDMFMSENDPPRIPRTDFMEFAIAEGDYFTARERAEAILADKKATPPERRLAQVALGEVAIARRDFATALKELGKAAADPAKGEEPALAVRTRALLERARLNVQLADDKAATVDLRVVTRIAPLSPQAAEARLILGMILLAAGDREGAIAEFKAIGNDPYLMETADEMLLSAPPGK